MKAERSRSKLQAIGGWFCFAVTIFAVPLFLMAHHVMRNMRVGVDNAMHTLALELHGRDVEAFPDMLHLIDEREVRPDRAFPAEIGVMVHPVWLDPRFMRIHAVGGPAYESYIRKFRHYYNAFTTLQACHLLAKGEDSPRVREVLNRTCSGLLMERFRTLSEDQEALQMHFQKVTAAGLRDAPLRVSVYVDEVIMRLEPEWNLDLDAPLLPAYQRIRALCLKGRMEEAEREAALLPSECGVNGWVKHWVYGLSALREKDNAEAIDEFRQSAEFAACSWQRAISEMWLHTARAEARMGDLGTHCSQGGAASGLRDL